MTPDLEVLLVEARARVAAMTPEEREAMWEAQQESWVRAELLWPKAKSEWADGGKVYESYEDYCND